MLQKLNYHGSPRVKDESVEALLGYMHGRAVEIGVSLNTVPPSICLINIEQLAHPNHPVEVQGYVGLFTWLAVQLDDLIQRDDEMFKDASVFHQRLFNGERQPNNFLEGFAMILREAHDHFDTVIANMLQTSILNFLTSLLLERHDGFVHMKTSPAGVMFPYFYRDMSGLSVAYAVFCYPKQMYPDVGAFLEAIPDMAQFINISNDVLSFYKEELSSDDRNYIRNRARCTGQPVLDVLADVQRETVECWQRISAILKGRGKYEQSWNDSAAGYIAMHANNPRYRFNELGLGEEHPLDPFEHKITQFLDT
ncbi:hypothetical protein FGADI_2803 [Fusarium gaditjirri]|uniref:Trichodiene synthase n=1 Tax=Fusarium gaditjirri TaxID=282569 RepID=A0A8H4THQ6_9HYPO|nr:hypothetical protein FGADI_2803 [Fusarium gaditjirri]